MSKCDPEISLRQILVHAREAVEICQGRSRSDLDSDRLLNLAVTRLIEIIGMLPNVCLTLYKRSILISLISDDWRTQPADPC